MKRYFYIWLFLVVVAGIVAMFFYRTLPRIHSDVPMQEIAEFGGVSLRIEYATTEEERERGLSGRENVPNDYAMLFVFQKDDYYGFWMKDTLVALDMFWLDRKGYVVSFAPDVATSTYQNVFYPSAPARYVLETAAGFARSHSIATGTPLLLKNFPSVSE